MRGELLSSDELLAQLAAVGHIQRLRIIGELAGGRVHVSELARRLQLSRPLLYMHLERLEKAGIVAGALELAPDGKAMKYFELTTFKIVVTIDVVLAALREDHQDDKGRPAGREGQHNVKRASQ